MASNPKTQNYRQQHHASAIIAMSGGVDSSVAAYIMKSRGAECAGVTLKLFDEGDIGNINNINNVNNNANNGNNYNIDNSCNNGDNGTRNSKACCSLADVNDARKVAHSLDIPFYVYNFTADFKKCVVDRFAAAYQSGATPNPCIDCNRYIKFDKLLKRAKSLNKDYVVTGHYARIEFDAARGRYLLKKALDETKDQSYVLYAMTQDQLAHTLFPLGGMRKSEVRGIAKGLGLVNANKRESQDICFVRDGDYAGFIERYTGKVFEGGNFIDVDGNILGKHKGVIRYTIGQRKGLGLALRKPMYVRSINVEDNTVTLCENDGLFVKSLRAGGFNWIAYGRDGDELDAPIRVTAKVRYNQSAQSATVARMDDSIVNVDFDEPQRAIAKGQAVVLYDGDVVVGGGTIL